MVSWDLQGEHRGGGAVSRRALACSGRTLAKGSLDMLDFAESCSQDRYCTSLDMEIDCVAKSRA